MVDPANSGPWSTESTWTIPEGVRTDWHYDLLNYTRYTLGGWRFVATVDNVNVGDAVVAKIKEQKPKRTFSNFSDYLKDKGVL